MYASKNFKTKKLFKEAVAAHAAGTGPAVTLYAPGMGSPKENGKETVEGPHYPAPHTWYAEATVVNGVVTKVK